MSGKSIIIMISTCILFTVITAKKSPHFPLISGSVKRKINSSCFEEGKKSQSEDDENGRDSQDRTRKKGSYNNMNLNEYYEPHKKAPDIYFKKNFLQRYFNEKKNCQNPVLEEKLRVDEELVDTNTFFSSQEISPNQERYIRDYSEISAN